MSNSKNYTIIKAVFTVTRKEYISPNYIRVFLTTDHLEDFAICTIGTNNKIFIPPAGVKEIYFPEYNFELNEWEMPDPQVSPSIRTYTHRGIDMEQNELWIDFIAHGDEGPASRWAIHCQVADVLGIAMHQAKSEIYKVADEYLFVADATGIPVISAILEDVKDYASGLCIFEVPTAEDIQHIQSKGNFKFVWLVNPHPEEGSLLPEELQYQALPLHSKFAYVAAEQRAVKEIRRFLRVEKGWHRDELYAYSYWKAGFSEDKSERERQRETETI